MRELLKKKRSRNQDVMEETVKRKQVKSGEMDLNNLVASVKRKTGLASGKGKRPKAN
jgi:hypothetical protein